MPKRAKKKRPPDPTAEKNPAAVALGKLGGLKGGPARAKALSKASRKAIAQLGGKARWAKARKKRV